LELQIKKQSRAIREMGLLKNTIRYMHRLIFTGCRFTMYSIQRAGIGMPGSVNPHYYVKNCYLGNAVINRVVVSKVSLGTMTRGNVWSIQGGLEAIKF